MTDTAPDATTQLHHTGHRTESTPPTPRPPAPPPWAPPDTAPCVVIRRTVGDRAAARIFTPEKLDPITGERLEHYDAGREALAACSRCDSWAECVTASVARNDRYSITGGAGGARRRALRRAWGTDRWDATLAAHGRDIHRERPEPGDADLLRPGGPGRECGRRGSFAVGCRCDACSLAAGAEGALASAGLPRSLTSAVAAWAGQVAA